MTTTFQVSDRNGDAIFVVKSENPDPAIAYSEFATALAAVGSQEAEATLSRLAGVFGKATPTSSSVANPLAAAQATAMAAFPGAVPQGQDPWGNPPVPPFQPAAAPQLPAAAAAPPFQPQQQAGSAPVCQHGPKEYITGTSKNPPYREWKAWACRADRNDPSKCEKEWIR